MVQVYEDPGTGQAPQGEAWSFQNAIAKGIAGTIGILAALVIDYIQKGDNSALLYATKLINQAALARFHISAVPPYIYVIVALIAGFAMVYIFEPTNKRNAFYAGAGVLGFLATFSPIAQQTLQIPSAADLPSLDSLIQAVQSAPGETAAPAPSTPTPAAPAPGDGGHAFNDTGIITATPVAFRPAGEGQSGIVLAAARNVPVNIVIALPPSVTGSSFQVKVWLRESASDRTQSLGGSPRFARMGNRVVALYQTSITTAASGSTAVEVRVEAEGCAIYENNFTIGADAPVARFDIALAPSDTPLVTQRLTHPYRW